MKILRLFRRHPQLAIHVLWGLHPYSVLVYFSEAFPTQAAHTGQLHKFVDAYVLLSKFSPATKQTYVQLRP